MKTTIGNNVFEDCVTLMTLSDKPLLAVAWIDGRLEVALHVESPPAGRPLSVEHNRITKGDAEMDPPHLGRVVVRCGTSIVLEATGTAEHTTVEIDFRELGLHVFTAPDGLHLGRALLTGNHIVRSPTGIALTD